LTFTPKEPEPKEPELKEPEPEGMNTVTPELSLENAVAGVEIMPTASSGLLLQDLHEANTGFPGKDSQGFLLPGFEGESIEAVMLPLLPGVIYALRDALEDAEKGRTTGQTLLIQEAASRLAGKAEIFSLDRLSKISRCVERAAEADDFEASSTLMEDLTLVTKRYLDSLQECYNSFLELDR
jgi:hypothetical protein